MAIRSLNLVWRDVVRELRDDRCIASDDDAYDLNELRRNVATGGLLRRAADVLGQLTERIAGWGDWSSVS